MNCSVCGGENSADARFCNHCGAPVPAVIAVEPASGVIACPSCGKPNKPGAKFCTSCSASLAGEISHSSRPLVEGTWACPQCDARNKVGVAFCVGCGHGLAKGDTNAKVKSPIMARLFEQKATSSPSPPSSPKAVAPDVTEKNEHVEMWDRGWDDETQANPVSTRTKSKPILWVLVAIAVGAVAGGGYVYFTRKANAPAQLPIQVPVPRVAQKPVPAIHPAIPNTQPMPPQPVSPEPNVDTPIPPVNSATSHATIGPKARKTKSATARPGEPPKSVSGETHAATSSASKNAQTTESNSQFESPAPLKSQAETPMPTSTKSSFERELEGCRKMGFFEKGICTERARWKYCNVGRVWDSTKPGCEIN